MSENTMITEEEAVKLEAELAKSIYDWTPVMVAAKFEEDGKWVVNEWLAGYGLKNVVVFDLFNVLTSNGGDCGRSDVYLDSGNHHRIWDGRVQHVTQEARHAADTGSLRGENPGHDKAGSR